MSKAVEVTDSTFKQEVLASSNPVLVDFWAPWCGPCRKLSPIIDELANELGDKIKIVKVDVDKNKEKAREYGIGSIPSLLIFKNGELLENNSGFQSKTELELMMRKYL